MRLCACSCPAVPAVPAHPQALADAAGGVVVVEEAVGQLAHDGLAAHEKAGRARRERDCPGRAGVRLERGTCAQARSLEGYQQQARQRQDVLTEQPYRKAPQSKASPNAHLKSRPGQRPLPPSSTCCTRLSRRVIALACRRGSQARHANAGQAASVFAASLQQFEGGPTRPKRSAMKYIPAQIQPNHPPARPPSKPPPPHGTHPPA